MLFRVPMSNGDVNAYELVTEFYKGSTVRTGGLLRGIKFMMLDNHPWYVAHYPRNILASPAQALEFEQAILLVDETLPGMEPAPEPVNLVGR